MTWTENCKNSDVLKIRIEVLPLSSFHLPSLSPAVTFFNYHLPTWFHTKIIGFKQSWTRVLICPYPGVKISVFTSGLSSTLHRFFNTIIWMLQEFILLYSLFQRMLCHLLIAKRTWTYKKIEHIWKRRAILNYFWLFCYIYFLVLESSL